MAVLETPSHTTLPPPPRRGLASPFPPKSDASWLAVSSVRTCVKVNVSPAQTLLGPRPACHVRMLRTPRCLEMSDGHGRPWAERKMGSASPCRSLAGRFQEHGDPQRKLNCLLLPHPHDPLPHPHLELPQKLGHLPGGRQTQ
ncbi:hypothetical protein D623_10006962 [Myotis brandtii]|uniref:Uncharacterized protein n=1 Tax=Myotis brandtii TaxID=109478 RepID=S7NMG5_MYOBR|nr:hypothetical protein D623_10006962 [Myotis brandtii]